MSERLKAVFFDLDGSLIDDGDAIRQALVMACRVVQNRWPELDTDELVTVYRQASDAAWGDYDRHLRHLTTPEAMLVAVWQAALARWNLTDPAVERDAAEAYWHHRLQHCRPYHDVFPLIQDLAQRFPLCLLTNGAPVMQRAKVVAAGVAPFFPHVFVGGDFARGKPDQAMFRAALAAMNCQPIQAVHIGDSLDHDIAGARNVGIHSVWLNRKGLASPGSPHTPDFEIATLDNLIECLNQLGGK